MVKRKKIILIAGLLIFLLVRLYTKGHSIDVYFKAKSWTKYIKNKDAEKMVKLFCSDIKNNSYHNTLEELVVAFEFIDGDIVKCKYKGEGGRQETIEDYETVFYRCYPEYFIETSKGKKFTLIISYSYIWKEEKEREGIEQIRIINYEGSNVYLGKEVCVGKQYSIHD